jgi:hypothetical protein
MVMKKHEKFEDTERTPPVATGLRPCQLIPSRLFAFFFLMEVWVLVLYLTGSGEGWPDSTLGFLARHLMTLGILSFVSAMLGIVFDIAETLVFKRVLFLRFVFVYLVLGVAGLAFSILGGSFQIIGGGL